MHHCSYLLIVVLSTLFLYRCWCNNVSCFRLRQCLSGVRWRDWNVPHLMYWQLSCNLVRLTRDYTGIKTDPQLQHRCKNGNIDVKTWILRTRVKSNKTQKPWYLMISCLLGSAGGFFLPLLNVYTYGRCVNNHSRVYFNINPRRLSQMVNYEENNNLKCNDEMQKSGSRSPMCQTLHTK